MSSKLNYISTGELTYWSTDTNKLPDLLDFFINKNVSPRYIQVNSSLELSSDHLPVIAIVGSMIIENQFTISIYNKLSNWSHFKESFNISTSTRVPLKTKENINAAVEYLTNDVINVARFSIAKLEYSNTSVQTL